MTSTNGPLKLREYQYEMFVRSLQGNVIVHMDTGSGKTHVALLRIDYELSRCRHEQLVWFLAPTVELCMQQEQAIGTYLPSVKTRLLTGAENIECWSEQRIWDAALDNVQVAVSTHAILADALRHGFVTMAKLALLVFDEAHHCTKRHPANVIMQDFYHRSKQEDSEVPVPHILGLSASLIMKSNLNSLRVLEVNLDAVSVTPRVHREELLRHVHRPTCLRLEYPSGASSLRGKAFTALSWIQASLNIGPSTSQVSPLPKTADHKSPLVVAITTFCKKAAHVHQCLGQWASECYILESLAVLREADQESRQLPPNVDLGLSKRDLLRALSHPDLVMTPSGIPELHPSTMSGKATALITYLSSIEKDDLNGIIFVEQRVMTNVLCRLLSLHPSTAAKFRCAPFVGAASSSRRRYGLAELFDLKAQREDLARFRKGGINTMISTNALEEGIDVQACNLVVCFDPPPNLKSFIQRRGRARRSDSSWCIMTPVDEDSSKIDRWQALESELERICQQERKKQEPTAAVEAQDEVVDGMLRSRTTAAMLTPDATLQHLHHFCQQLPREPYVDHRPVFSHIEDAEGGIRSTVTLPSCISATVRETCSERVWKTERAAAKDVAFQAYCRLYEAGLLNENLLPLSETWDTVGGADEATECSLLQIQPQFDVWTEMAAAFDRRTLHRASISIRGRDQAEDIELAVELLTPCSLPVVTPLTLYWSPSETFDVSIRDSSSTTVVAPDESEVLQELTLFLHGAAHSERKKKSDGDIFTFIAIDTGGQDPMQWLREHQGSVPATTLHQRDIIPQGFLRVPIPYRPVYHFVKWAMPSDPNGPAEVECTPLRKRRRYQTPFPPLKRTLPEDDNPETPAPKIERHPIADCDADLLPLPLARLGLFLADIYQHISDSATGSALNATILRTSPIPSPSHLQAAISAPCAGRPVDYQRHEFVGDTLLKYLVATHLYSAHPTWHEGFLTVRKAHLVSNPTLARAALASGLDRYIITDPPHARSWSIPSLSSVAAPRPARELPLKLLADVVEALVGAAYLSSPSPSSLNSARACLNAFMPSVPLAPLPFPLPPGEAGGEAVSRYVVEVEELMGHRFANRGLVFEALTHGSCPLVGARRESYQRLEFLGDAVLDLLVVRRLAREAGMRQGAMTGLRAAVVNAELLGFLCMGVCETGVEGRVVPMGGDVFETGTEARTRWLWRYLRHDSRELGAALATTFERYQGEKEVVERVLWAGERFPWEEMFGLKAEKVFSDVIESLLGAILVDTGGDLDACERFMRRVRLSEYLDRAVKDEVTVEHPKGTLQRLAGSRKVTYTTEHDGKSYACRIEMEGAVIAVASGSRNEAEAVTAAARRACEASIFEHACGT